MIDIHFTYKKPQVIQALRYHFLSKREIRLMIILVNVFALASAVLFYSRRIVAPAFLAGSILWFVLMITFWFVLPSMVYKRASTFQDSFRMQFTDENFTVATGIGSRSFAWKELSTWIETPNFFHLYFDNRSFFLVPKDAFPGTDETYALRQILKEKVKK